VAYADVVWTPHTDAGVRLWQSTAMSADGTRIIAAAQTAVIQSGGAVQTDPGYLYLSTNGGASWSPLTQAESRVWSWVTSSANGMQLAAISNNGSTGYVVTSQDGGSTWVNRQVSGYRDWRALAYSRDGSTLAAVAFNDGLFISNDNGATWRQAVEGSHYWTSVALSSDGQTIAATKEDGPIQISHDGGTTWNDTETTRNWRSVTVSADGDTLAAAESGAFNSKIYISTDSGNTWAPAPTKPELSGWLQVTSSSNGNTFVATNYYTQRAYASTDGGALWYELAGLTLPRGHSSIALTDAGDKIAVLANDEGSSNASRGIDRIIYTGALTAFVPTAPTLTNIAAQNITRDSARITWDTDLPATSKVEYGTDTNYGSELQSAAEVANHAIDIYGLSCGTTYHYQVSSTAYGGATTVSSDYTFETLACLPPIEITNVAAINITTAAATITWRTPVVSDSVVEYGLTDEYTDVATKDTLVRNHSVRLSGLTCGTTYHYKVSSSDVDGATGSSTDYTFATLPCPIPTISDINVLNIAKNALTVFWKTAVSADSTVEYGTTPSYGQSMYRDTLQKQRNMRLTGLTCGTTYHYRVSSVSAYGQTDTSADATVTTLACSNE